MQRATLMIAVAAASVLPIALSPASLTTAVTPFEIRTANDTSTSASSPSAVARAAIHAPTRSQASGDHVQRPGDPSASALEAAFGFRLGEERRYVLGPDRALEPGEQELWIIRLQSIEPVGPRFRAVFALEHESLRYRGGNMLNPDERIEVRTRTRLVVNEYGFPLEVGFEVEHRGSASPYSNEGVSLTFADDHYRVENPRSMGYRDFPLRVASSRRVDLEAPRGVYLAREINPGLLSLVFTTLHDGDDFDVEYMALNPTPLSRRNYRPNAPFTARRRAPFDVRPRDPWGSDVLLARKLEVKERTFVEVGGREVPALRIDTDLVRGHVWLSPDGTVLRIDTRSRRRDAWIRLLHPSEY